MKKKKEKKKVSLKLEANFGQDFEGLKNFNSEMLNFLEPLKKKGLINFKLTARRKCDYCEKTLEEGDKYRTLENEKDICEECEKGGKLNG